jgi:hypothetical protein
MARAMAFAGSILSSTIDRVKKPFNPLLGETYELQIEDKQFRFISEQVSHHPPISAGFAESPIFKFWGDTNVKTAFWGKSLEVKPLGYFHLVFKQFGDHIVYSKNKSRVNNIILGKTYIDHEGAFVFKNHTNGDSG